MHVVESNDVAVEVTAVRFDLSCRVVVHVADEFSHAAPGRLARAVKDSVPRARWDGHVQNPN